MPATVALTEFNRSPNAVLAELADSGAPYYLTKNGRTCAVIMDPEAFERAMSFRMETREREMRVYHGVLGGYKEFQEGKVTPAADGLAAIRAHKGWS